MLRIALSLPLVILLSWFCLSGPIAANDALVFSNQQFTEQDAVLVMDEDNNVVYEWRSDQLFTPASLVKLLTSYLAIEKWGLSHRFKTEFYQNSNQLWVKGYGDPYLVSEEIDLIAIELKKQDLSGIKSIHIDASYFGSVPVPGRSSVADPYNAPLSAVSANFNTVYLQYTSKGLVSAEPQTSLTETAKSLAASNKSLISTNKTRVNLVNATNAQRHFAEILVSKLGLNKPQIFINQQLPDQAELVYQHYNSESLETVLTGAMKYSNNFIANQVFLKLAEGSETNTLNFNTTQMFVEDSLKQHFSWERASIVEGAGLSRDNKLSAKQIDDLLLNLKPYQRIFKQVELGLPATQVHSVYAKTGTLNGVRNYAGYINFSKHQYRFVFMFNRATSYRYRDTLLKSLTLELSTLENE